MSLYVNLMSPQARLREVRRRGLRRWARIWLAVLLLALPMLGVAWRAAADEQRALESLKLRYAPVQQLLDETKQLREELAQRREEGRLALALSEKTPVAILLGLVADAVGTVEGRVFLQHLQYEDHPSPFATGLSTTSVTVMGIGFDRQAKRRFSEALAENLPFAAIEITDSASIDVAGQTRDGFTVNGQFPITEPADSPASDRKS